MAEDDRVTSKQTSNTSGTNSNSKNDEGKSAMALPKPQVKIIVEGDTVYKPGMKSYLMADETSSVTAPKKLRGADGTIVGGTVCTCDTVTVKKNTNTCPSYRSGGGGSSGGGCSCNKICTCNRIT